jgi:hypothetical protein
VIPNDSGARLARLLADMRGCEGLQLDLALARSAELFAGLGAQSTPRRCGGPGLPAAMFTLERAQRELSRLIDGELLRLCELAAALRDPTDECALGAHDLAELLHEELDCAASMGDHRPGFIARVRRLAVRLPLGLDDAQSFQACAASLRRSLQVSSPA